MTFPHDHLYVQYVISVYLYVKVWCRGDFNSNMQVPFVLYRVYGTCLKNKEKPLRKPHFSEKPCVTKLEIYIMLGMY